MIIGVPKEVKDHEYRVGLIPSSVAELIKYQHQVIIESDAGIGIGFTDEDYKDVGATIVMSADKVFATADMIIKVKEPQTFERHMLRPHQILFTYLHLAADNELCEALMLSKAVCIAYETITDKQGHLPLLAPMSAVAGRMSVQAGAQALEKSNGGCGMLLAGVPGVEPAKVVIIGGGIVGRNAAQIAVGMGAQVVILDTNPKVLSQLDKQFGHSIQTVCSTSVTLEQHVISANLIIGAVLIPGAKAPKVINKEHIKKMKNGTAIVDVAIDQGGCVETSKATTHSNPTFIIDNVVHYCVANMPGAVPRTSTLALNNATLPYIIKIANKGFQKAMLDDHHLMNGLNVFNGHVTCKEVADSLGFDYVDAKKMLKNDC
jgi:alanine dehydrogenase